MEKIHITIVAAEMPRSAVPETNIFFAQNVLYDFSGRRTGPIQTTAATYLDICVQIRYAGCKVNEDNFDNDNSACCCRCC